MHSSKPKLIISTCGISLATHIARQCSHHYPPKFSPYDYANLSNINDTDTAVKNALKTLINDVRKSITQANINEQCLLSAELNALWRFYNNQPEQHTNDLHFLIHTDTWLGENVAKALQTAMQQRNLAVNTQKIDELRTSSLEGFRNGTGALIGFLEKMLIGYKDSHQIIFNLSGGFKSIQGVMQSLASIYADEVIYIFERSDALLRVPRLPMSLNWQEIEVYLTNLRRLALTLPVNNSLPTLPTIFLYQLDDQVDLSEWGQLIAQRSKQELYTKKLLPTPSTRIRYGNKFERSLAGLDANRIQQINERIDDLARFVEQGTNLKRLDFKGLKGKGYTGSTHEMDAWADQDAKRIFCHYDKNVSSLNIRVMSSFSMRIIESNG